MIRGAIVGLLLLAFGAFRVPIESSLTEQHRSAYFHGAQLGLDLREQVGQLGFLAALSGFRSLVADAVFIQAHVAWERTEWGRVLLLFRQVTTLQPRSILFWDMAAWHMAWNASVAASRDPNLPNDVMRRRAQREYFELGKDFLERGIKNNPERPQLYESLARLYKEKLQNHAAAARYFAKAAALPGAPWRGGVFQSPRYRSRFRQSSAVLLRWAPNFTLRATEFSYTTNDFRPTSGCGMDSVCGEARTERK